MQYKSIRRYQSFCKSINNLKAVDNETFTSPFALPGVMQCFCLAFDLSWKVMKDILTECLGVIDFGIGSPSQTLEQAFSCGLIDTDAWKRMLKSRNQLAHDYNGTYAIDMIEMIEKQYLPLLEKFCASAQKYYNDDDIQKIDI